MSATDPNSRNGPPRKPTDRHERPRLGGIRQVVTADAKTTQRDQCRPVSSIVSSGCRGACAEVRMDFPLCVVQVVTPA